MFRAISLTIGRLFISRMIDCLKFYRTKFVLFIESRVSYVDSFMLEKVVDHYMTDWENT